MIPTPPGVRSHAFGKSLACAAAILGLTLPAQAQPAGAITPRSPEVARAIAVSVQHLKSQGPMQAQYGREGLHAYALIKGGVSPQDAVVQTLLQRIGAKFQGGRYTPRRHHWYEAACDIMALEAADPAAHRDAIRAIAVMLVTAQNDAGGWNYPHERNTGGDTSITQYCLLGLWAAQRAGVDVPFDAWDRAAMWLSNPAGGPQNVRGGFQYRPGGQFQPGHSMTAAGVGSLYLCRQFLYPDAPAQLLGQQPEQPKPEQPRPETLEERQKRLGIRWGVLEPIPIEPVEAPAAEQRPAAAAPAGRARTPLARIDLSIRGGMQWLVQNFTVDQPTEWPQYYLYGLERMTALGNIQRIGTRDWYVEGAAHLVRTQQADGTWSTSHGEESGAVSAAFGILFLSRSTHSLVGAAPPADPVAGGLLKGGRLPGDLAAARLKEGNVEQRKLSGPFEELLADLAKGEASAGPAQQAIVEQVRHLDRNRLIGQKSRLVELARHADPNVRLTAIWALGRTDDLDLVPLLLEALNDPNVDVNVEAYNALCFLSRKPEGVGLAASPYDGIAADAADEVRKGARDKWREVALDLWTQWHFAVRPYDQRDDLQEKAGAP